MKTTIDFEVDSYLSNDCSTVVINRAVVTGENPVNSAEYWVWADYIGPDYYNEPCPSGSDNFVGNRTLIAYPGVSAPSGHDFRFWIATSTNTCLPFQGARNLNINHPQ